MEKLRIGISSCLLGEMVRYDGGHKRDPFLIDTLSQWVEYVPVCPEVECGLPIPREAMRLVGEPEAPRLVTIRSGVDHTEQMQSWAAERVEQLAAEKLSGFIFKSKSPSSGLYRVKVYNDSGMPLKVGSGMFARAFTERFPLIPVEEEGRLHDPRLRESFIERIFVMHRFRALTRDGTPSMGELVAFHTRHKLLILAHSPKIYREMGKLVAEGASMDRAELVDQYLTLLMRALELRATAKKQVNVLQHVMGYFKQELSADEKQELLEVIDDYRQGDLPLIVPITLLKHYVRKYGQPYLADQWYLDPHPMELRLRNHV